MITGSLDTNVLLRLILQDDMPQHEAAASLFYESKGQLAVADLAITEMVFVLTRGYEFNRRQIAEAVEGIIAIPKVNCNRMLYKKVLPLFLNNPKLSFEDCCLAVYSELNNAAPLWTFDKKLANQAKRAKLITIEA